MNTELAIVVPTFNEVDNIELHYLGLQKVLTGVMWEVVYVDDDSPDGTNDKIRALAQKYPNVRIVHRIGRRGLSSAAIEGILSTSTPYVAVMDCDMQHDEKLLPHMLAELKRGKDIVIGSRFVEGGDVGSWNSTRLAMSKFAAWIGRFIVKQKLSDPMSGFFMITRDAFAETVRQMSGQGFKILLDIFASSPRQLEFTEMPFSFGLRQHGESKVDSAVLIEYAFMLIDKVFRGYVSPRLVFFVCVGALGVLVHFAALYVFHFAIGMVFETAQTIATAIAMTFNFGLNNEITYRNMRLRGMKYVWGLISFYAVCGIGVLGNVGIASYMFQNAYAWWLSAIAGILIGTAWNFSVSNAITWRQKA